MAKKFFGAKNNLANMPQEVVRKSYPKKNAALGDDSYVDTQSQLDEEFNKALGKVRRGMRK